MIIKRFITGLLETNCYLVACQETLNATLIDAGFNEAEAITVIREIGKKNLKVKYVLNTHWHPDHTAGNEYFREKLGALVIIHEDDAPMLNAGASLLGLKVKPHRPDKTVTDGDLIEIGKTCLKVIHTPGHTRGSICLLGKGVVFTGDTLFAGSIGRTDLPGGSFEEIIGSIRNKLMTLPDETLVYPGHGPFSSIGKEKRTNPFLTDIY
ncbi:MAG: MBL fold metallo-hydrolase [Candidatus Brockarchaeota archaeon]|nr:MBL fold metallo-hydrolase [Candidatus Brockarchaeota archaeon]